MKNFKKLRLSDMLAERRFMMAEYESILREHRDDYLVNDEVIGWFELECKLEKTKAECQWLQSFMDGRLV